MFATFVPVVPIVPATVKSLLVSPPPPHPACVVSVHTAAVAVASKQT